MKMNQKTRIFRIEQARECRILERLNRFVVKIEIKGQTYRAHINNTGRLSEFMIKGRKAFCYPSKNLIKTDAKLFAVGERGLGALIDTQLQMKAFEMALRTHLIPWLKGCRLIKRNAMLGTSLIDYLLECRNQEVFLEVKSAVLRENQQAMYPDCPSDRGQRHIKEITEYVRQGGEAFILFMAALPQVKAFKPNREADPLLSELLVGAARVGVKVKAIGLYYDPIDSGVYLYNPDLEIKLEEK
jgi:sugar fermentation stimulation protein A